MKITKKALLGTALLSFITVPALAADKAMDGKKTKEITEIVGYDVTEKIPTGDTKSRVFEQMDANADGDVNLKEFENHANLDNEYEIFVEIDTDHNKLISFNEYANFNKTKGNTQVESQLHGKVPVKGTNIKSRSYVEKNYFVPTDRKIVNEEVIEPAAGGQYREKNY